MMIEETVAVCVCEAHERADYIASTHVRAHCWRQSVPPIKCSPHYSARNPGLQGQGGSIDIDGPLPAIRETESKPSNRVREMIEASAKQEKVSVEN